MSIIIKRKTHWQPDIATILAESSNAKASSLKFYGASPPSTGSLRKFVTSKRPAGNIIDVGAEHKYDKPYGKNRIAQKSDIFRKR